MTTMPAICPRMSMKSIQELAAVSCSGVPATAPCSLRRREELRHDGRCRREVDIDQVVVAVVDQGSGD
jgi:hypothetical protein